MAPSTSPVTKFFIFKPKPLDAFLTNLTKIKIPTTKPPNKTRIFDGEKFLSNTSGCKEINQDILSKFAPNVLEGVSKLKQWSENI